MMLRFISTLLLLTSGADAALRGQRNLGVGFTTESPTDSPIAPPPVVPEPAPVAAPVAAPVTPETEAPVAVEVTLPSLAELAANATDLSTLVEIATLVGVAPLLMLPGEYTVFAPTNDAFAVAIDVENLDVIDPLILMAFLQYHVVLGTYTSEDITDGLILTTVQGETIEFAVTETGITVNEENIIMPDIKASNGVVHVIDGVMYPKAILGPPTESPTAVPVARKLGVGFTTESPTETPIAPPPVEPAPVEPVVLPEPAPVAAPVTPETEAPVAMEVALPTLAGLAANATDLSTLVEIVTMLGIAPLLDAPGAYTVFAPTNEAFAVAIDLENLDVIDPLILLQFLQYHVVLGIYTSADITDGMTLTTLQGETIEFDVTETGLTVNEENIIMPDIMASNGVVHVIDGVMYPKAILGPPTESPTTAPVA